MQSGDSDTDGIAVGTLSANGGTLKDAAGNDATLTLNSVASTTNVLVDAIAPTVSSVSVPSNATYVASQNLDLILSLHLMSLLLQSDKVYSSFSRIRLKNRTSS